MKIKIFPTIPHLLASLVLLFSKNGSALACKPSQHFNAQFEVMGDRLSGSEAGRLGAWITDMQRNYPKRPFFLLITYQDEARPDEEIAERRGKWVKDFLIQMGEDPNAIIYGGTTLWKAENVGAYSTAQPTTLGIEFGPGCPNACCDASAPVAH